MSCRFSTVRLHRDNQAFLVLSGNAARSRQQWLAPRLFSVGQEDLRTTRHHRRKPVQEVGLAGMCAESSQAVPSQQSFHPDVAAEAEPSGFLSAPVGRLHDARSTTRHHRITSFGEMAAQLAGHFVIPVPRPEACRSEDRHTGTVNVSKNSRKIRTALSGSAPRSRLPDRNCCSAPASSAMRLGRRRAIWSVCYQT